LGELPGIRQLTYLNMTRQYAPLPIKSLAEEDRPREKLLQRGIDALTDAELIAILLGSGTTDKSAIQLAQEILKARGNLGALARCGVQELTHFKGVGPAKAITLVTAFELGRRKAQQQPERYKIGSSIDAARYLQPRLSDLEREVFYILCLNRNHEVIYEKELFRGGISATVIDPKLVFREAFNHVAAGIIVAHNHPSGNLKPSMADVRITQKLLEAGHHLELPVLDHLIISYRGYFSFADEGLMKRNLEAEKKEAGKPEKTA